MLWVLWRSEFWSTYMEIKFWLHGFHSNGVLIKWDLWRSGFDWRGLHSDGVLIVWVLWRSDFDRVGAKIMGLFVFWFNGFVGLWFNVFFRWVWGMVVVIGGLLGFHSSGKSNHYKDQHGLMVGFSSNFCFRIVVVIYWGGWLCSSNLSPCCGWLLLGKGLGKWLFLGGRGGCGTNLGLFTVEREKGGRRKEERQKLDRGDYFLGYIFYCVDILF